MREIGINDNNIDDVKKVNKKMKEWFKRKRFEVGAGVGQSWGNHARNFLNSNAVLTSSGGYDFIRRFLTASGRPQENPS